MNAEQAKALREKFPPEVIGKLPRISCLACSKAAKAGGASRDKHCDRHQVTKCAECGNYLTTAHIHLDYVGHAATTDRLLKVDPEWTWRPLATEVDTGFPRFDKDGGLWILLTVAGVTRPGYGDGANPKEVISDAIRNAAMRFGVALDLWAKEDLQSEAPQDVRPPSEPASDARPPTPPAESAEGEQHTLTAADGDVDKRLITKPQQKRLFTIARGELKLSDETIRTVVHSLIGSEHTSDIQRWQYDQVLADLRLAAQAVPA